MSSEANLLSWLRTWTWTRAWTWTWTWCGHATDAASEFSIKRCQSPNIKHKTNTELRTPKRKSQMAENRPWLGVSVYTLPSTPTPNSNSNSHSRYEGLDIWSCVRGSLECLPVRWQEYLALFLTSSRSRGEIRWYGMENQVTSEQQGRVIDVNMSARTWKWTEMGLGLWIRLDCTGRKHKL